LFFFKLTNLLWFLLDQVSEDLVDYWVLEQLVCLGILLDETIVSVDDLLSFCWLQIEHFEESNSVFVEVLGEHNFSLPVGLRNIACFLNMLMFEELVELYR
jgi:hypothetical protein